MSAVGLGARLSERLAAQGLTHLVSVANGEGFGLYQAFKADSRCRVIDACREGEAVALCCGLVLGGQLPVLSIENFGLFECLDTLRALPLDIGIPMLLVIGYTGRGGKTPEGEAALVERLGNIGPQAALAGRWTEPVLQLAGIPFWYLDPADSGAVCDEALALCRSSSRPVALLVDLT